MKLSAYHYAVALRGLVAGTRYTLPMSWPVATDYLISLGPVDISRHSGESRNPGALESRHRSHSGHSGFPLSRE